MTEPGWRPASRELHWQTAESLPLAVAAPRCETGSAPVASSSTNLGMLQVGTGAPRPCACVRVQVQPEHDASGPGTSLPVAAGAPQATAESSTSTTRSAAGAGSLRLGPASASSSLALPVPTIRLAQLELQPLFTTITQTLPAVGLTLSMGVDTRDVKRMTSSCFLLRRIALCTTDKAFLATGPNAVTIDIALTAMKSHLEEGVLVEHVLAVLLDVASDLGSQVRSYES